MKQDPVIFVIEDNPVIRKLVEYNVKKEVKGTILSYDEIHLAIEDIKTISPDIIILDYSLNDEDISAPTGLDFLKRMRKLNVKVPTIVFSGQCEKMLAIDLLKNGAVDYVSKNSGNFINELRISVRKVLALQNLQFEAKVEQVQKMHFLYRIILILGAVITMFIMLLFLK